MINLVISIDKERIKIFFVPLDILDSTERTPLLTSGALYTPRDILNSSTTQRSFRNTNSYIARLAYYSNLRLPENSLAVPPHIAAQYLVLPQSQQKAFQEGGRQSSLVTIFAIWNTMMGTSMLSMAWGLQQSGFLLGLGELKLIFKGVKLSF